MNNSKIVADLILQNNSARDLVEKYGSPLYVYSEEVLENKAKEMAELIKHPRFLAHYSTKANANPALLGIIKRCGIRADALSAGEIALLKLAGFSKNEICYVCNNASEQELLFASKEAAYVSVDSLAQLESFIKVSPNGKVMVRLNPGVGAGHHEKVVTAGPNTKFGISESDLPELKSILRKNNVKLAGLNHHIGSLFIDPKPYLSAATWLLNVAEDFLDSLEVIDFGGGFGISYQHAEESPKLPLESFGARLTEIVENWTSKTGYNGAFFIEPGRYIVAQSGLLIGTVNSVKQNSGKWFVGTDIGFSVLIRPVMYNAYHEICILSVDSQVDRPSLSQNIVGNICESGDYLATERILPQFFTGDFVGILDAGAYGSSMSSNYNQRFRPAEVLIQKGGLPKLIRRRDSIEDILRPYVSIEN